MMGKLLLLIGVALVFYYVLKLKKEDSKSKSDKDIKEIKERLIAEIRLLKIKAEQGIVGAKEQLAKSESDLLEINDLDNKIK